MAAFKKLKLLGRGSYASVYLAEVTLPYESNEMVVAVKCSSPLSYSISSLQKEKQILDSFLGCQEILQSYFDQFTHEKNYIIYNLFMELAPHGSLDDLIKKRSLSTREVRMYTHMLLKGLSCIHRKGIVHCDLKPENILLFPSSDDHGDYYQLKIADFGVSKTKEEIIKDGKKTKFRGTCFYMSPESVVGIIDTPLDIWSLGCIVIEMITGFRAWKNVESQKEMTVKLAYLKEVPPIPNGLSWDIEDFLNKCLVKDPSQRWNANMLLNHPFISPANYMHGSCESSPMSSSSGSNYEHECRCNILMRCTKCFFVVCSHCSSN